MTTTQAALNPLPIPPGSSRGTAVGKRVVSSEGRCVHPSNSPNTTLSSGCTAVYSQEPDVCTQLRLRPSRGSNSQLEIILYP
ncbi:hypothetical protein Q5P01_008889 [Channa striata]|uniref:Uncharacterized protein n=1 Tax=Channa striata TaxID=64152 RepID=A0AA88N1I1_CHASR|nr:hypothetical protein Q5P01_008889 [Channa striata]